MKAHTTIWFALPECCWKIVEMVAHFSIKKQLTAWKKKKKFEEKVVFSMKEWGDIQKQRNSPHLKTLAMNVCCRKTKTCISSRSNFSVVLSTSAKSFDRWLISENISGSAECKLIIAWKLDVWSLERNAIDNCKFCRTCGIYKRDGGRNDATASL